MIRRLHGVIGRLHAGQLAMLWAVALIAVTVGAWMIASAPAEYQRAAAAAAGEDSEWDSGVADATAAADSARDDLRAYYLIRAHEPQVFWPLLESDNMALVAERTAVKTAKTMREVNREMLATEQGRLDARSTKAEWVIAIALTSVIVLSWVWFAARSTPRGGLS